MSKPRGYDDKSLVSASVSKLARLRCTLEPSLLLPLNDDGAVDILLSWEAPGSIWKGNEPSPLLAVEPFEATLMPRALRFGG